MHAIGRHLLTLALATTVFVVHGQEGPAAAQAPVAGRSELPLLAEWFLSTGDWEDDPQLYVREFGSGAEPIVVLHGGWGGEHSGLLTALQEAAERYRFVLYDQRGSLRSPSLEVLITFDQHVEDVERLRQELQLDTLRLVGHSMGTVLAGAYAAKYPARVEQLILLAPAFLKNPLPEEDQAIQHQGDLMAQAFLARPDVAGELAKYGLDRQAPPLSSREHTARHRINVAARMLYDVRNWRQLTGGRSLQKPHVAEITAKTYPLSGWDYFQEYGKHSYRVSIVAGDHDFVDFGNLLIRKWAESAPRVELRIIPNAGHLLWIDQPDHFTKTLLTFLERPQRKGSTR